MPINVPKPARRTESADCSVCGHWPRTLRATMRCAINVLPLKETVCEGCVMAFWDNIKAKAKGQRPS